MMAVLSDDRSRSMETEAQSTGYMSGVDEIHRHIARI